MNEIHQIFCLESDTSVVFALGDSLFRSTDGGTSWAGVLGNVTIDGDNLTYHVPSHTLYFMPSDSLSLWSSQDEGAHWIKHTDHPIPSMVCTIAVSPSANPTILAGAAQGRVMRSVDEGSTWQEVLPGDWPTETSKLIYSKSSPGTVLTTSWKSKHRTVMLSTDDGQNWSDLHLDSLWVWALEIDPDPAKIKNGRPQHFWTGLLSEGSLLKHDVGETTDGGNSWTYWDLKDSSLGVWVLKYDPPSRTLIAATSAGIFLQQTNSGVSARNESANALQLRYSPQAEMAIVSWGRPVLAGELLIHDLLGRTQLQVSIDGEDSYQLENSRFTPGIYLVELRESNGTLRQIKWMR